MARSGRGGRIRGRAAAWAVLGLLAVLAGFAFAGAGTGYAPPGSAREWAEQAAALRIALSPRLVPTPSPLPVEAPPEPVTLLADGEQVRLARHATRVRIPSTGLDTEVRPVGYIFRSGRLEYDVPRVAAGQYPGSAAPGEPGNLVIGGHVATRSGPAVFRELGDARPGDSVEIFRGDQIFRYLITEIRIVDADATEVMAGTENATVTLITCVGAEYSQRLVVIAVLA